MTFKNFEELFKSKYPEGTVYPHDVFEHRTSGKIQKVGVTFTPDGKVYLYRGAYEDILCKCGINVISKERYSELVNVLKDLEKNNGKTDEFFGAVMDYSEDIAYRKKEIANIEKNFMII